MDSDGSCCSRSVGCGLRLREYRPRQEAGSRVDSDRSCCSRSVGCGLLLHEYSFLKGEAGNCVESDGSCCSDKIGRRLRLLEYRPRQEVGNRMEADGSCRSDKIGRGLTGLRLLKYSPRKEAGNRTDSDSDLDLRLGLLQNGAERSQPKDPPFAPPDIILSFPSPSPQSALNAHRLMSRGMMMGLPVKASGPPAEKSLPAACRHGHWNHSRCCPNVEKKSSGT